MKKSIAEISAAIAASGLLLASCAGSPDSDPSAFADAYFNRIHMNCDGNILLFDKRYNVIEFRDGSIDRRVDFFEPSAADELNRPDFRGAYRYTFEVSSDVVRNIDFNGNISAWRDTNNNQGFSDRFKIEVFEYDDRIEFNQPSLPGLYDAPSALDKSLSHLVEYDNGETRLGKPKKPLNRMDAVHQGWTDAINSTSLANVTCDDFRNPSRLTALMIADEGDFRRPAAIIKENISGLFGNVPSSWPLGENDQINPGLVDIPWGHPFSGAAANGRHLDINTLRSHLVNLDEDFSEAFGSNPGFLAFFDDLREGSNKQAWMDFLCQPENTGYYFGSGERDHFNICNGVPELIYDYDTGQAYVAATGELYTGVVYPDDAPAAAEDAPAAAEEAAAE